MVADSADHTPEADKGPKFVPPRVTTVPPAVTSREEDVTEVMAGAM
jgi:hypothetical protein